MNLHLFYHLFPHSACMAVLMYKFKGTSTKSKADKSKTWNLANSSCLANPSSDAAEDISAVAHFFNITTLTSALQDYMLLSTQVGHSIYRIEHISIMTQKQTNSCRHMWLFHTRTKSHKNISSLWRGTQTPATWSIGVHNLTKMDIFLSQRFMLHSLAAVPSSLVHPEEKHVLMWHWHVTV